MGAVINFMQAQGDTKCNPYQLDLGKRGATTWIRSKSDEAFEDAAAVMSKLGRDSSFLPPL